MEYAIERKFAHRTHGEIASVTLTADVANLKVNGKDVPAASVEYLLTFALQSLQDAYAGADSTANAKALFEKKLEKLIAGEIGVRGAGEGASEETKVQRSITKAMAKKNMGEKSEAWASFTGLSDADQNAKLDAWYKANEAALEPFVKEELARREKARKAKAALANSVSFEL